jgi:type I restriction enzyme M protein
MNLNDEVKKQFFKTFEILKTTLSVDQILKFEFNEL